MFDELNGKTIGLVFSGAVAHGAFEAGFLGPFAGAKPKVVQVAGTSSGSLNAVVVAAGIAAGRLDVAASKLQELWADHASLLDVAAVHFADLVHVRGAFTTDKIQQLVIDGLREVVGEPPATKKADVTLTVVTTNLNALPRKGGLVPLPTFEQAIEFSSDQLLTPALWPDIARAAGASATFPGVFAPTQFGGNPCIDGGAVNNAPISRVLTDPAVNAVVVITTEAPTVAPVRLDGLALIPRIAAALINERIAYDLTQAKLDNHRLAEVNDALRNASEDVKRGVLDALGLRALDLFLVQPAEPLPGDSFSGFFSRANRLKYIEAGKAAKPKLL